jgi:hypothetical protein
VCCNHQVHRDFLITLSCWRMSQQFLYHNTYFSFSCVTSHVGNTACHETDWSQYRSVCIATCYSLDSPGTESRWGARFSAPVETYPEAHIISHTVSTGSFPGVKRPGRAIDHPPTSSAEVKERVELYLYSSSWPSWTVLRRILLL